MPHTTQNNSNDLISVIMPVRNTAPSELKRATQSILNQTHTHLEFIIIDDGSDTPLKEFFDNFDDSRIIYLRNETQQGISYSLNRGLDIAKGEYIARMDSDDYSYPERLECQLGYMTANPKTGVCSSQCRLIDKTNKTKESIIYPELFQITNSDIKLYMLFFGLNLLIHPLIMFKKSVIDKHDLRYNEKDLHAEDFGMWLKCAEVTEIAIMPKVLLDCYRHETCISVQHSNTQQRTVKRLQLEALTRYFTTKNNIEKYNQLLEKHFSTNNTEEILNKLFCPRQYTAKEGANYIKFYAELTKILKSHENFTINTKHTVYQYLNILRKSDFGLELFMACFLIPDYWFNIFKIKAQNWWKKHT